MHITPHVIVDPSTRSGLIDLIEEMVRERRLVSLTIKPFDDEASSVGTKIELRINQADRDPNGQYNYSGFFDGEDGRRCTVTFSVPLRDDEKIIVTLAQL